MRLVLASGSATRRDMLTAAGLRFDVVPPDIDEEAVKQGWTGTPSQLALKLARRKAASVSERVRDALVVGADQILDLEGRLFSKPADRAAARAHLQALAGRTHRLRTAMVMARDGEVVAEHQSSPALTLWPMDDAALDQHMSSFDEAALQSVGAYRVETRDIRLFRAIEGNWHDVLGLPLLVLLGWLRDEGVV